MESVVRFVAPVAQLMVTVVLLVVRAGLELVPVVLLVDLSVTYPSCCSWYPRCCSRYMSCCASAVLPMVSRVLFSRLHKSHPIVGATAHLLTRRCSTEEIDRTRFWACRPIRYRGGAPGR